ncbi:MAG: hypothetical protein II678_04220, partial [Erysipelotrichaceae bacterium]|nr:hypothetical protein [Erysipelotrichaceae bacterium]
LKKVIRMANDKDVNYNIYISGVGGQGIIKTSVIIGEAAMLEAGVHNLHPELVRLLGKMKFRTSRPEWGSQTAAWAGSLSV